MLREPRTSKSFRDAGGRIVRQESAVPDAISRLLGSRSASTRAVASTADIADARLAALATLARSDALAVVDTHPPAGHNVVGDPTADPLIRSAVDEVRRSAGSVQLRAAVPLADGRLATTVLVTSLANAGAVLAFRVGRPFSSADAYAAVAVADILSLELARSLIDEREATVRRQALALYEIARHALFGEDLSETLQNIATVLASSLDHQAVHIWLSRGDGWLLRHAAHPFTSDTPSVIRESDHTAAIGALQHRRVVRLSGVAAWTPAGSSEFIVAPLRGDPRPAGIVVLGRTIPYASGDVEMADVIGTFIGQAVAKSKHDDRAVASRRELWPRHTPDAEAEVDLAPS
jgi:hypothetical protein